MDLLLMVQLTTSAEFSECFCFQPGIWISHAMNVIAIKVHTVFTFTCTSYSLCDWIK